MTVRDYASIDNAVSAIRRPVLAAQRSGLLRSTALVAVAFVATMALIDAGAQQYFDGAGAVNDGAFGSPPAVWDTTTNNWADIAASNNAVYNSTLNATTFGSGNFVQATGGTVTVGAGIVLTDVVNFRSNGNNTAYSFTGGDLQVGATGTTLNVTDITGDANTDAFISSVISANGAGSLTKTGAGTLNLNAVNTFTGDLNVNAGSLFANAVGALGSTTGALNISGGTIDLAGLTHTKGIVTQTGGTITNGTAVVTTFAQTGGTFAAVGSSAGISVIAVAGAISQIDATGIVAANGTANGIEVGVNTTLLGSNVNNVADNGITLNNYNGGNVTVTLNSAGNAVTGFNDGINIKNGGGGLVTIEGTGGVQGGVNPGDDGIDITTDGSVSITLAGAVAGNPGIVMFSNGGGNLSVTGSGDVTGAAGEGIRAVTVGGNGVVTINRDGDILGATNGVNAWTSNAGAGTGTVTITSFAGRTITGTTGAGVTAQTEIGLLTVNGDGGIIGGTYGIEARTSVGGTVVIGGAGITTSNAAGSTTILAHSVGGSGQVTIDRAGLVTNNGAGGTGIDAQTTGTGAIEIISAGRIRMMDPGAASTAISAVHLGAGLANVDRQRFRGDSLCGYGWVPWRACVQCFCR